MQTWWSAIDTKWSSFDELRHRKVVAQGWRDLGDLRSIVEIPSVEGDAAKDAFKSIVVTLGDIRCKDGDYWQGDRGDRQDHRAPTVFWNLFLVAEGDLVVALEGTEVRGVCRVPSGAGASYKYEPAWDYAQTIGGPVEWLPWNTEIAGPEPTPPQHGVLGICRLGNQSDAVADAWQKLNAHAESEKKADAQ